ncbi:MAG: hypothetical protein KatS3mg031_3091 [Chitinophagales bacterium]|nr:MAG: hypothetical protein KatS3mg031_3091 [Chitinophagales bacterium]
MRRGIGGISFGQIYLIPFGKCRPDAGLCQLEGFCVQRRQASEPLPASCNRGRNRKLQPRLSSLIPHPSSLIPHPSSLIPHPSSLVPRPSFLIPHPSSLTSLTSPPRTSPSLPAHRRGAVGGSTRPGASARRAGCR